MNVSEKLTKYRLETCPWCNTEPVEKTEKTYRCGECFFALCDGKVVYYSWFDLDEEGLPEKFLEK